MAWTILRSRPRWRVIDESVCPAVSRMVQHADLQSYPTPTPPRPTSHNLAQRVRFSQDRYSFSRQPEPDPWPTPALRTPACTNRATSSLNLGRMNQVTSSVRLNSWRYQFEQGVPIAKVSCRDDRRQRCHYGRAVADRRLAAGARNGDCRVAQGRLKRREGRSGAHAAPGPRGAIESGRAVVSSVLRGG